MRVLDLFSNSSSKIFIFSFVLAAIYKSQIRYEFYYNIIFNFNLFLEILCRIICLISRGWRLMMLSRLLMMLSTNQRYVLVPTLPVYLDYPYRFFSTFEGNPVDKGWGEKMERTVPLLSVKKIKKKGINEIFFLSLLISKLDEYELTI